MSLVVGNWKMALSHKGELELARALKRQCKGDLRGEVIVCPSFPALAAVSALLARSQVAVGAQAVHWEETGAVTGAVSVTQIAPFVKWCIVGHSETRWLWTMTDEMVVNQVGILLRHGITPIVCLGETREERDRDLTVTKITKQTQGLLQGLTRTALAKLVIAYEPIWAISANDPVTLPDPDEVASAMLLIRKLAAERFDSEAAQRLRIIYGGSVNAETIGPYAREPGVNGVLVGSASLQPRRFLEIIEAVIDAS